jgi:hypothetical protein
VSTSDDAASVEGSWSHSFEEDEGDLEVFRPTMTYPFPPSRRGRRRLTFSGGEVVEWDTGPDDRSQPRGTLRQLGPLEYGAAGGGFEIVEATPEVLRIRRS